MSGDSGWSADPLSPELAAETEKQQAKSVHSQDDLGNQEVTRLGRVGRVIALLAGVIFLGGIAALVVSGLNGDPQGAESPSAAVEQLSLALSNEDVLAALEVMAPSEVGSASVLYPRVVELAVREGALENADWLAGVDFTVTGLETRTEMLHPEVALVELVSGSIRVSFDPKVADQFWFQRGQIEGSITIDDIRSDLRSGLHEISEFSGSLFDLPVTIEQPNGIFIMTVKRDDSWFASPFYTAAELGRRILDLPEADFSISREQALSGASVARGVVDDIVSMVNDHTIEEHVEIALSDDPNNVYKPLGVFIPPDEAGVFLDYGPSYLALAESFTDSGEFVVADFQREIAEFVEELNLQGQISMDVNVKEENREDGTVVLGLRSGSVGIEASTIDFDSREVGTFDIELLWRGLCGQLTVVVDDFDEESISECFPLGILPLGFSEVFFVVDEVDGYWYLSYIETLLSYAEIFLEDLLAQ